MQDSKVYQKAFKFSVRIYRLFKFLNDKNEYVIGKQISKSHTLIGANIAEANGAISDSDFANKISIAYKEALETKYWLELINEIGLISRKEFDSLYRDLDEICKMLWSAIKTIKSRKSK